MEFIAVTCIAVIYGALPVNPGQRGALCVRDRNHRHVGKNPVDRLQICNVEPAVQSREIDDPLTPGKGEM